MRHFVSAKRNGMTMKISDYLMLVLPFLALSCHKVEDSRVTSPEPVGVSRSEVAMILSRLDIRTAQMQEVHDAVSSSSGNGYDEEYMMTDLFNSPGSGVGDGPATKTARSGRYSTPLKDLITDYLAGSMSTKAGAADVQAYIRTLEESGLQIYWPYSEDWDGQELPIITYDPGYGAESNYGYVISEGNVVDSVLVDENLARSRPVWVINSNDDCGFTPMELFATESGTKAPAGTKKLYLEDFTMLRNYDSWFGGASEFFVKCGAVDGFKASKDEDLKLYYPSVTDFMVVVRRKQLGKPVPLGIFMLSDVTDQMDKVAFLVVEDDGGTATSWKCSATVKYNSKNYGFDIEIPYKEKDDIVWRGQLPVSYFNDGEKVKGRFGDVEITFALE